MEIEIGKFVACSKGSKLGKYISKEEFERKLDRGSIESEYVTEWYPDENGIARPCRRLQYYEK